MIERVSVGRSERPLRVTVPHVEQRADSIVRAPRSERGLSPQGVDLCLQGCGAAHDSISQTLWIDSGGAASRSAGITRQGGEHTCRFTW